MPELMKKNTNRHFKNLCSLLTKLEDITDPVSDLRSASLDYSDKKEQIYLYDSKDGPVRIDMDVIKLDDMTESFKKYMVKNHKLTAFEQPKAVDAVCIDRDNEWFLIEFKNCKIKNNSSVLSSIRGKMFGSLWFISSLSSFFKADLFGDDFTDFSRRHITYIVVASREKNTDDYDLLRKSFGGQYTPYYFEKYKGYYFKDVLLYTEEQFQYFVRDIKL